MRYKRGVCFDISKAFDKAFHEGLIFKLKQNGISGKLLHLIKDFLSDRGQRVVLSGQCSSWMDVQAGVPKGSILWTLFILIYVNDLPDNITSNPKLFADDTSLFSTVTDPNPGANQINIDLQNINRWAYLWYISFNPDPSKQVYRRLFLGAKLRLLLFLNLFSTIIQYIKSQLKSILECFSILN